jgi:hypothetical protein
MNEFEKSGFSRRLFVEPTVIFSAGDRRYPDLVVCNTQTIIGVVELKYAPRATPETEKDLETLERLALETGPISLANERFRGPGSLKAYPLSPDAVLCWAGVREDAAIQFNAEKQTRIGARFLRLEAVTHDNSSPTGYAVTRP